MYNSNYYGNLFHYKDFCYKIYPTFNIFVGKKYFSSVCGAYVEIVEMSEDGEVWLEDQPEGSNIDQYE